MPLFEIWMEGYAATGEHGTASFEGRFEGKTFADACKRWAIEEERLDLFDEKKLTYWGCRLFDNERDARRMFG